jgi:formylglycine-generating enzyme required for sulfatase activity
MKRHVLLGISLLVVGIAIMKPGRVEAASMAVLVVGLETDAASDAFAASIKYEYTQKGYTMANDGVVLAKQTELRNLHKQNQPVDTAGLAAWGKTNNIDFVQLVVENSSALTISGRDQVAQVVTCGTTKYTGRSYYRMRFAAHGTVPCESECGECECGEHKEVVDRLVGAMVGGMIPVVGGVFEMGCKSGRDNISRSCESDELPVHYVRVNSFYIGRYAVTQALWKSVMGALPNAITGDNLGDNKPIGYVSWEDVADSTSGFLKKLNDLTGKNYRLPTEAEWEYAARGCDAGVCDSFEFSGSNTAEDVAWHSGNASYNHVVGEKSPNRLGLYDMSGNVWNWCSDWYRAAYYPSGTTASNPQDNPKGPDSGSYHVIRGGGWVHSVNSSRVANRPVSTPGMHVSFGFRLV